MVVISSPFLSPIERATEPAKIAFYPVYSVDGIEAAVAPEEAIVQPEFCNILTCHDA